MKRSSSFIKRKIALFLVLLLSIESFAAVVGDNDGAAFITKAEFDSLKNDFQSQLDRYNSSIDNKIDGAIAAYLAGINITQKEDKQLKHKDWEEVIFLNFSPQNQPSLPDYDMSFGESYYVYIANGPVYPATEVVAATIGFKHNRNSLTNARNLVDAGIEMETTMPDTVIWEGRARNLYEQFIGSANFLFHFPKDAGTTGAGKWVPYLYGAFEDKVHFFGCGLTHLKPGFYPSGYDHLSNQTWWPRIFYYSDSGGYATTNGYLDEKQTAANATTFSLNWSSNVRSDSSGKTKDYVHIINYDDVEYPQLTDLDWVHTLRTLSSGGTFDDVKNAALTSSKILWVERASSDDKPADLRTINSVKSCQNYYSRNFNTTDNDKVLGIGIINKTYNSEKILQTSVADTFDITSGNQITVPKILNLYEGFALLASDSGSQIEWKPVFTNRQVDGVNQDFEMNIMLALEPFGERDSVSADKIIKIDGTTNDYITTSSGNSSIKFTMPEKGIVYMKAWPTDSTILTKKWEATLDLTSCGHYIETK